jgi:undecaprenyl-diphosphatase
MTFPELKLLVRRERPNRSADESRRRLVRGPRTSSFPSGHSASAFAFAAGAGLEAPELVVPLGLLAARMSLDGEVSGTLPADFVVVGEALRVVTPIDFEDLGH